MVVVVTNSEEQHSCTAPGAFQQPPYRPVRPVMWFKQAEGLMDLHNITNPSYHLVLVQLALSVVQQEAVAPSWRATC